MLLTVLQPTLQSQELIIQRATKPAQIASQIRHPNGTKLIVDRDSIGPSAIGLASDFATIVATCPEAVLADATSATMSVTSGVSSGSRTGPFDKFDEGTANFADELGSAASISV